MAASIITSVVTGGTNSHQTVAEDLNVIATDFVSQGVVGTITAGSGSTASTGGFAVTQDASPDMGVTVLSGNAYVSGTPSGQDPQVLRGRMTSNYTTYTINANSSGSTKYDWIYLQLSATNANNPSSAADNVITLYTSRSTSNTADNGAPPTYGLLLAVVTVANAASSITNANIADKRVNVGLSTVGSASATGWNNLTYPLTYAGNNGSKEFTVTTPNNLTSVLSPGMRLSVQRSVTPPTQSMSFFSGSSQYATKASPSGITFTAAFTCEAWISLSGYTGQTQAIVSRTDGSNGGFYFAITSGGQVRIGYGSATNFTEWTTYQSIPLNRWVHVAGVVSSVSGKTLQGIYINGTSVNTQNIFNASTALTQTANLSIGAYNTGAANTFFFGGISEVRVWSVAQTATAIQNNMGINLVGNESNLVALYQGNGNFNDATSNANNLTANGGAIATSASNPYGATDYAIVRAVTYSAPTTTITLFTDDYDTIPNQTLNNPQYSTAKEPQGWPAGLISDKILGTVYYCNNMTNTATATGTQMNGATLTFTIPTGNKRYIIKSQTVALSSSGTGAPVLQAVAGGAVVGQFNGLTNNSNGISALLISAPFLLGPGTNICNLDMLNSAAGTATFAGSTTTIGYFSVEEA